MDICKHEQTGRMVSFRYKCELHGCAIYLKFLKLLFVQCHHVVIVAFLLAKTVESFVLEVLNGAVGTSQPILQLRSTCHHNAHVL